MARQPALDAVPLVRAIVARDNAAIMRLLPGINLDEPGGRPIDTAIAGPDLAPRLVGIAFVANMCRMQGDLVTARALAEAIVDTMSAPQVEEFLHAGQSQASVPQLWTDTVELLASCWLETGHYQRLVKRADVIAAALASWGQNDRVPAVRLAEAEALMLAGEYEAAKHLLEAIDPDALLKTDRLTYVRLASKLARMLCRPDVPVGDTPSDVDLVAKAGFPPSVNAVLEEVTGRAGADYDQLKAEYGMPAVPPDLDAIEMAAKNLPLSGSPHAALKALDDGIAAQLVGRGKDDPEAYRAILRALTIAIAEADALEFWEHSVDLRWRKVIALRRLGDLSGALATTGEIRVLIDRRRLGIADPRLRAALAVYIPHLAVVTAELATAIGQTTGLALFAAVESAKSRIIAESRERVRRADLVWGSTDAQLLDRVCIRLATSPRAHYLSFLVDDGVTYLTLVSAGGKVRGATARIGRTTITDCAAELRLMVEGRPADPDGNGRVAPMSPMLLSRRSFYPIIAKASPVLAPIGDWLAAGELKPDDVIIYAPDEALFNLPLTMLCVGDRSMHEMFDLACVPSARLLVDLQNARVGAGFDRAFAAVVPHQGDGDSALASLSCDARWLVENIGGDLVLGADATLERVQSAKLARSIVHFSTHGVFDDARPLFRSGLQLAKTGLPNPQSVDALLTPEFMAQLPLADAHVTLRACVSGLATQITSREPLGAIHGLFSAGAASVLAAAWNVDMRAAGEWMLAFYRAWASPGVTPARAQRLAINAMKRAGRDHPFEWAPFVLYGVSL
jgi:hypothetical protein